MSDRKHRRWTSEELAILRQRWTEDGARTLRKKLGGRTEIAIGRMAIKLGLASQTQGRELVREAAERLGLSWKATRMLADECGVTLPLAAPVRTTAERGAPDGSRGRRRAADSEQLGALLRVRDTRVSASRAWARERGVCAVVALRRLWATGLRSPGTRGVPVRLPDALWAEVWAGVEGPWTRTARVIRAMPDPPCAMWLLLVAAHDYAHAQGDDRAWLDHLPQRVSFVARGLWAMATSERRAA